MRRLLRSRGAALFVHRAGATIWALLAIPAYLFWQESVLFVIAASIYANVKSDLGAANAADDREVLQAIRELREQVEHCCGRRRHGGTQ